MFRDNVNVSRIFGEVYVLSWIGLVVAQFLASITVSRIAPVVASDRMVLVIPDTVGPVDDNGISVGGSSLFIWNNELRFPIVSFLDGVGFLDIGNVYPSLSDFDPTDVRKAAGIRLRARTPFVLIRFDYGFKLDRQPGESRVAFFFSIGQAF